MGTALDISSVSPVAEEKTKKARKAKTDVTPPTEKKLRMPKSPQKRQPTVKVIFLGGVGEIGKNMTAIECGNDIIVIDAGLTFPNEEMPGIDSVVPDFSYLVQNKDKVRAVILTHGHEDHIGGVPYLMKELNPDTPIYGTKLTLMLTDNKLQEHRLNGVLQRTVEPGDKIPFGCFMVEFLVLALWRFAPPWDLFITVAISKST